MSYKLYDAEIEYLEGSGTQYILTNIPNRSAFSMSIKFMLTSDASYEAIFGSVGSSPRPGFRLYRYNATMLYAQSGKFIDVKTTTASIKNVAITFSATANNGTLSISSTYGSSTTTDCDFTASGNWAIFTSLVGGGASGTIIGRIYSFTYSSSEQNVDLIPVRVGNVGYMYDRVSGQLFGNAGTGSFVLGPDVAPGRYANEVAFLESTGSQYIDTGISITTSTKLVVDGRFTQLSGASFGAIHEVSGTYYRFHFGMSGSQDMYQAGVGNSLSDSLGDRDTDRHTFQLIGSGKAYLDLVEYTGDSNIPNLNIYLFGRNFDGNVNYCSFRAYSSKIYSGETLVQDLVPVQYNGIGYMYDKVSGEFFANQGTGKFVLGHRAPRFDGKACARSYTRRQLMMEVGQPTYIQDGLVFWLDGINKGASNGTWIEKIHGTIFSGNATSVDKGFNFSSGQRMSGSWVNGTSTNFTVEVCYYTTQTRHFLWGVGTSGSYLPVYHDNNGAIATIQNLHTFQRPTTVLSNKTVSINQNRGIYNGVSISKNTGSDWWYASPNASTAYIGKGNGGGASSYPLTGIIYAIRVYNRRLTAEEMLYNQRIDNRRFNLGLNI